MVSQGNTYIVLFQALIFMKKTKVNKKNLHDNFLSKKINAGFTLVEVMVVLVIILVVGTMIVGVMFAVARNANKAKALDAVKKNGNYAIEQMGRSIRYARTFDGVSPDGEDGTYVGNCTIASASNSSPSQSVASVQASPGFFATFANKIPDFGKIKQSVSSFASKLLAGIFPNSPPETTKPGPRREVAGTGSLTINADFDAQWKTGNICTTNGSTIYWGHDTSLNYEYLYARFPLVDLNSLPAGATITKVTLSTTQESRQGFPTVKVQAYNQDGQADPTADTCVTVGTRSKDDPTPYISSSQGTGSWDLGAQGILDINAAKVAVDRFSVAVNTSGMAGNEYPNTWTVYATENGTNVPRLIIDYTTPEYNLYVNNLVTKKGTDCATGITTNSFASGDNMVVCFTEGNSGNIVTPQNFVTTIFRNRSAKPRYGTVGEATQIQGPYSAGYILNNTTIGPFTADSSVCTSCTASVFIDSSNTNSGESNESDNFITVAYTVSAPTPTPTPTPIPVSCSPSSQQVYKGARAEISAVNGDGGLYTWSASEGNPTDGIGSYFAPRFDTVGIGKEVIVQNGLDSSTCLVNVIEAPEATQYKYVQVTDSQGEKNTYSCISKVDVDLDPSLVEGIRSIDSTGVETELVDTSTVRVDSCSITCKQDNLVSPPTVSINFSLSSRTLSDLPESKASIPFQTSVTARNY